MCRGCLLGIRSAYCLVFLVQSQSTSLQHTQKKPTTRWELHRATTVNSGTTLEIDDNDPCCVNVPLDCRL
jgi:hypothetical protein